MCEFPPVETLCISSTPGRACVVGESNRLCRVSWATSVINAASRIHVVPKIFQALCEVCRRDERREKEEEEDTGWDWMHVSGGGNWGNGGVGPVRPSGTYLGLGRVRNTEGLAQPTTTYVSNFIC